MCFANLPNILNFVCAALCVSMSVCASHSFNVGANQSVVFLYLVTVIYMYMAVCNKMHLLVPVRTVSVSRRMMARFYVRSHG